MSRIRKVKVINILDKKSVPGKYKMFSKLIIIDTCVDDVNTLKAVCKSMDYHISKGNIGKIGYATTEVDNRITNKLGYEVKDGKVQFISTSGKSVLVRRILQKYNQKKIEKRLKKNGFKIKEKKKKDPQTQKTETVGLEAQKGEGENARIIEVDFKSGDDKEDEFGGKVSLHSKNFKNSKKCKESLDEFNDILGENFTEDWDTNEFAESSLEKEHQRFQKRESKKEENKRNEKNQNSLERKKWHHQDEW